MTAFLGDGSCSFVWGGDERKFKLSAIGRLRQLQDACDAGPVEVLERLQTGKWRFGKSGHPDYREVIRLGLLGAGLEEVAAIRLLQDNVDNRAPLESIQPAILILMAALTWPKDDNLGKEQAEEATTKATAASSAPRSTGPERRSDFRQRSLTNSPSGNSAPASRDGTRPTVATPNQST